MDRLKLDCILSLQEICLRRVSVNLWSELEVLTLIENFYCELKVFTLIENYYSKSRFICSDSSERWRETVESKVAVKLSEMAIPKSLADKVSLIIAPIGTQIKRWKEFHERYLKMTGWEEVFKKYLIDTRVELGAPILSKLCWTSAGLIDYKKTADKLIRCEMVDIVKRYKLACLYCLDDCIPFLWEELPEEIKRVFYNEKDICQIKGLNLPFCWPYILKGEQSKLDFIIRRQYDKTASFNRVAFENSARRGNKAATEYFFQKLASKEKEVSLQTTAPFVAIVRSSSSLNSSVDSFPLANISDVLFYLLSQMNPEEQMLLFKLRSVEFLIFCLDWQWHDVFLSFADLTWTFLPAQRYEVLLKQLTDYIGNNGFLDKKLFREFFIYSPVDFKNKFVDWECKLGYFFSLFFSKEDAETINVIFRNVESALRLRLVSSKPIFKLFHSCFLKGNSDMVRLCLRESMLSTEDQERLKEAFMAFRGTYRRKSFRTMQNQFFQLLDDINAGAQSKRSSEDEILKKAKKFRSNEC